MFSVQDQIISLFSPGDIVANWKQEQNPNPHFSTVARTKPAHLEMCKLSFFILGESLGRTVTQKDVWKGWKTLFQQPFSIEVYNS